MKLLRRDDGRSNMRPIAITLGDPGGIGAEVVFKALIRCDPSLPLIFFGDWNLARQTLANLNINLEFVAAHSSAPAAVLEEIFRAAPNSHSARVFVDVGISGDDELLFGTINAQYGRVALESIKNALRALDHGLVSGLVTAPIHKQSIAAAGTIFPGHTELLAAHSGLELYGRDYAMYFDSPRLKVVLLSVHVPLKDALANIDPRRIAELAALTTRNYQKLYGSPPRIAVAGVNPHAGEAGMFGDEELRVSEGVRMALDAGLDISGPHPPDTIFLTTSRGNYDVVMAMYHDQGLIPVKTLDFEHSVNVTLGLPYLRCSVDHGTAFDIAGKRVADEQPMLYAIEWAARHAGKFDS